MIRPGDLISDTNDFVQAEIRGFNWAGIEAGLLYDRREDERRRRRQDDPGHLRRQILGADMDARRSTTAKTSKLGSWAGGRMSASKSISG